MRDFMAAGNQPRAGAYEELSDERKREIDADVCYEIHVNRYNPETKTLELTPGQAYALAQIRDYWEKEFSAGDPRYGFLKDTIPTPDERGKIADFFFWTAWAAGTNRPGLSYTYTNNWPPDRSVGNHASTESLVWSIGSIISLFSVLGLVVYIVHRYHFFYGEARAVEASYKLLQMPVTPSQRASAKLAHGFIIIIGVVILVIERNRRKTKG